MKNNKLLRLQTKALRETNSLLRQSVPPDNRKYLPEETPATPAPPSFKDRFIKLLPKIAKGLAVFTVLGGISALIIIEILILLPKKIKPEDEGTPIPTEEYEYTGLNALGGNAVVYGGELYYITNDRDYIYCTTKTGKVSKAETSICGGLTAYGDKLYFIARNSDTLYSYTKDGGKKAVGRIVCTSALVRAEGIYCVAAANGTLRLYTADGLEYTELTDYRVKSYEIYEGLVYTVSEDGTLRLYEDGKNSDIAENINKVGQCGSRLYASNGKTLFTIEGQTLIDTGYEAADFNGNEDFIICQSPDNKSMLTLYSQDKAVILAADYKEALTVCGNMIVYTSIDGYRYKITPGTDMTRSLLG